MKARLAVREKQFQVAARALQRIMAFDSAPGSVFLSEVQLLQSWALEALKEMENLQRPVKKHLVEPDFDDRALGLARKVANFFKRGGRG